MRPAGLRTWFTVHQWSSLACTLFMLVACVSGLPLVFSAELRPWLNDDPPFADLPAGAPRAPLDPMVAEARRRFPQEVVISVVPDDETPSVAVMLAPTWQAWADPAARHYLQFDARTGTLLREASLQARSRNTFLGFVLRLHRELFAGLPGNLLLGAMGLLLAAAIVSGAVLYGPYMQKLDFGTVRAGRGRRLRWLDLHNLLGIVTLAWALVVAATGALNEVATPLFALWQRTDVQAVLRPWQGHTPPGVAELRPVQQVYDAARGALPGMQVLSIAFPGPAMGSPFHYQVWMHGDTPLTSRLFHPVLVDARSGAVALVMDMPWYLRALELSRPLHFGDYGGLSLKLLWAVLDLVTIAVLGSGLYLWWARRQSVRERIDQLAALHAASGRHP
ncbi:MAG: PepSY-associated TM helix domain-containing protein [Pseudomonadota bacterium]